MRFDTVLTQAERSVLPTEVAALRLPRRRLARGVSVSRDGRGRPWQFQAVVDDRDESWTFDRQGDTHRDRYADGVLHSVDGPGEVSFPRSGAVAPAVRMLTPEMLLLWGPPASYSPVLVQRIKGHWLLFTFEHEHDPAHRRTLVIDERDGIAHRSYEADRITMITSVRVLDDDEPIPPRPRFPRLQEWPSVEY
ncbi:hypothetical protein [Curtobacterium sp. ISL-83]|uniref:hypothetical protein n=1 Tax=Curtobacterium sp. ISL-83 TaxID=2819145 RepID=UPI001BEB1223|nr:hypothetical protein [Curtobacterium sp. ISL-83]MBT2503773.1 hypothetical protein [Curtobacterium sp. ISL-83]